MLSKVYEVFTKDYRKKLHIESFFVIVFNTLS